MNLNIFWTFFHFHKVNFELRYSGLKKVTFLFQFLNFLRILFENKPSIRYSWKFKNYLSIMFCFVFYYQEINQSHSSNWYINGKVFTSTTPWKPKNLNFQKKFEIEF